MISNAKGHLREATKRNSARLGSLQEPLSQGLYIVNDDDVETLLVSILDVVETLLHAEVAAALGVCAPTITTGATTSTAGSIPNSVPPPYAARIQSRKSMDLVPPSALNPATTINIPEASFADPAEGTAIQVGKRQDSTTMAIVSDDNVTEITWLSGKGRPSQAAAQLQASRSDLGCANKDEISDVNYSDDNMSTPRRSLVIVAADEGPEADRQGDEASEEQLQRPSSFMGRLRQNSIQMGQKVVGAFVNGSYRNADYRERRESSIFRIRSILQGLEPQRPKENPAVFSAFTGAQPVQVADTDYVNSPRRPGPLREACSEDGRQHTCTQHETTTPG